MLMTVATRLVGAVLLLVIVSVIAFSLTVISPRHPEIYRLGPDAPKSAVTEVRRSLGLDRPLIAQFLDWGRGLLAGDLGRSYVSNMPVAETILARAPRTLSMVGMAIVIACLAGGVMGLVGAVFEGTVIDRLMSAMTGLTQGLPSFWLGIVLVTLFALTLGWLPATGYVSPAESVTGWVQSILLPSIALGLPSTAAIARQLRGAMLGEMSQDYVRSAVAQGYSRRHIALHQVLRNALGAAVTVVGLQVIIKLSTVVVVERVFAIDGLGTLALDAVIGGDTPTLLGTVIVFAMIVVVINFVVDLLYLWISPTMRSA
jgi:peptide/nickel transport system permease protein